MTALTCIPTPPDAMAAAPGGATGPRFIPSPSWAFFGRAPNPQSPARHLAPHRAGIEGRRRAGGGGKTPMPREVRGEGGTRRRPLSCVQEGAGEGRWRAGPPQSAETTSIGDAPEGGNIRDDG